MPFKDFLPLSQPMERRGRKRAQAITIEDNKAIPKLFKVISLAVGFTGGTYSLGFHRINFEPAPYDFNRIIQAIDTDSYVKEAFHKHQEMLWKEGWAIVGENTEAVDYLYNRFAFMELAMGQPIQDFFMHITDQLAKFSNAFVVKVRGDLAPYFPDSLKAAGGKLPLIGYQVVPAETMEIMRDYHNKVIMYRQNVWGSYGYSAAASGFGKDQRDWANLLPTWRPEEVIHFKVDVKPGRIFGTPFMVAVMDDVISLRQVEEDIQNLIHRELFPLYKYKVGTEDHPAEPEEVAQAAQELEGLRTQGGLVLPDRHDVEVIGAEGKVLDVTSYLDHFKERVAVGLGLSKHHLGMQNMGSNRAVTDNLDQALYDKTKLRQQYTSTMIQLKICNELLLEGDFDPYVPQSKTEDRCVFIFNEIDVDTQIKKENHIIQKWISDMIPWTEMRLGLKTPPDVPEDELYTALSQRMLPSPGQPVKPDQGTSSGDNSAIKPGGSKTQKGQLPATNRSPAAGGNTGAALNPSAAKAPSLTTGGTSNKPNKPDAAKPSTGGAANKSNKLKKGIGNRSRPSNQFGRSLSPNVRHDDVILDLEWLTEVVELVDSDPVEILDSRTRPQDVQAPEPHDKMSKIKAHYREADDPKRNCDVCKEMCDDGTCELVQGTVKPSMVCDLFQYNRSESRSEDNND